MLDVLKTQLKNGTGIQANAKDPSNRKDREVELMDLGSTKKTSYDDVGEEDDEEEEEGFWSKVARVCLNLLKKFVRWMND